MPAPPPEPSLVAKAIDIYLRAAYDGDPPNTVCSRRSALQGWDGQFYTCPVITPDGNTPPDKYLIRLGNRHYPHMKLVIERAPDGQSFLFRADTHDRHVCPPPGAAEHAAFVDLMHKNQHVAQAVESAWAEAGIPTFKTWLKDDLAKRGKVQDAT